MLTEIYIRNYLMMPEIRLPISHGLTVISGETGAGKSILVGSIALIFGDNAPGLDAWDPEKPIYLEATFMPGKDPGLQNLLAQYGAEPDAELVVARETSPTGKSTYFFNGRKTTAAQLKELRTELIDFHHQRDQQKLLGSPFQLELLDAYAGAMELRESYGSTYRKLKCDFLALQRAREDARKQAEMLELYTFQYEELAAARLVNGEEESLQQEYELLTHAQEIAATTSAIKDNLFESDNAIYDQLNAAYNQLKHFQGLNPLILEAVQNLSLAMQQLQDADRALNSLEGLDHDDPERLELIQARLDTINALAYKHRVKNTHDLLELMQQREEQISACHHREASLADLEAGLETTFTTLKQQGEALSLLRGQAIPDLAKGLQENIRELSIPHGRFEIRIDKKAALDFILPQYLDAVSETGQDQIQFLFTANAGFDLKPLSAVASGGELSRILLAIKKVLAAKLPDKLMILDEIDAGIGGKTAGRVAEFISSLATQQQVMAITHLAQIAAVADTHLAVEKHSNGTRDTISIRALADPERLNEIARMLGGSLSERALEHAKELILKKL